ncbi:relaxase domain-containing protein [Streptomyces sp. NPDC059814]|uniref:relaxase domain-containing protein n=1 Tax=Streptomyces sp. NPDC059814 TaxID=3346959 RepID=UPI0036629966
MAGSIDRSRTGESVSHVDDPRAQCGRTRSRACRGALGISGGVRAAGGPAGSEGTRHLVRLGRGTGGPGASAGRRSDGPPLPGSGDSGAARAQTGAGSRGGRRVRLAFRAPDSVSWVWAQGDPALRVDLERSVLAAADRCVGHLVRTRPLVDGVEPGRGYAAALTLHAVGSPGPWTQPPPPLLHVHAYLVGVLDGAGTLRSPDYGQLYEQSLTREGGAVGRAALAGDLRDLGFNITSGTGHDARGFEVTGVPEALLRAAQSADKGCAGLGEETDRNPWDYVV